jgi:hypothetical protein
VKARFTSAAEEEPWSIEIDSGLCCGVYAAVSAGNAEKVKPANSCEVVGVVTTMGYWRRWERMRRVMVPGNRPRVSPSRTAGYVKWGPKVIYGGDPVCMRIGYGEISAGLAGGLRPVLQHRQLKSIRGGRLFEVGEQGAYPDGISLVVHVKPVGDEDIRFGLAVWAQHERIDVNEIQAVTAAVGAD